MKHLANKIRHMVVSLSPVVMLVLCFWKLMNTIIMREIIIGILITLLFAVISFHLLFKDNIKTNSYLLRFLHKNRSKDMFIELTCILSMLVLFIVLLLIHRSDSMLILWLKAFLGSVLMIGVVSITWLVFNILNDRSR